MGFSLHQPEPPSFHWLSGDGRPVASVRYSPEQLRQRSGITFTRGRDDLDRLSFAAYSPSAQPIPPDSDIPALIVLIRYDHDPDPGTTVYADADFDIARAQNKARNLLKLTWDDFTWRAETSGAESNIEAPPGEQEVVKQKQAVVTGEVEVRKQAVTETQRVSDTVRREAVHVEGTPQERVHVEGNLGNLTAAQRQRYEGMSEADRVRYGRFTEAERTQYDALTPEEQRRYAADWDRRNPLRKAGDAFTSRSGPARRP